VRCPLGRAHPCAACARGAGRATQEHAGPPLGDYRRPLWRGADDGADAAEIAELQAEVSKLDRTLRDAITKYASGGFEQVCADIQKRDGCSRVIALQKARTEAPDAFIAYQRSGVTIAKAAGPQMDRIVRSPFDDLVDGIRARDKALSRTAALAKARIEHPREFEAYRRGE
jgi:hypothetical protein